LKIAPFTRTQTDKQLDKQAGRHTDRHRQTHTNRHTCRDRKTQTARRYDKYLNSRLAGWLAHGHPERQTFIETDTIFYSKTDIRYMDADIKTHIERELEREIDTKS